MRLSEIQAGAVFTNGEGVFRKVISPGNGTLEDVKYRIFAFFRGDPNSGVLENKNGTFKFSANFSATRRAFGRWAKGKVDDPVVLEGIRYLEQNPLLGFVDVGRPRWGEP